jgi:hypothetical protein
LNDDDDEAEGEVAGLVEYVEGNKEERASVSSSLSSSPAEKIAEGVATSAFALLLADDDEELAL